jgi:hypothetical protein
MEIIECPQEGCGAPAEVLDSWSMPSTAGPVEHGRLVCLSGHRFLMPLPRRIGPSADTSAESSTDSSTDRTVAAAQDDGPTPARRRPGW